MPRLWLLQKQLDNLLNRKRGHWPLQANCESKTTTTTTTNVIPIIAQLSSWRQQFCSSAASSAYPAFAAPLVREFDCSDEVTVTSNAAGFPALQVRTKMFPGPDWLSGMRIFFPLLLRDSQMSKQRLYYLESGHVLQLRLLDRDTQWHDSHRCQELLLSRTNTSFRLYFALIINSFGAI